MAIAIRILNCAIIIAAMMISQASASQMRPKRLNAQAARAAYDARHPTPSPHKKQSPIDPNKKNQEIVPLPEDISIINISSQSPNGQMDHAGYTFKTYRDDDGITQITGVYKDGKQITYTQAVHESIKSKIGHDLEMLIKDNLYN